MSGQSQTLNQSDIDRLVDGSLAGDAYRKMIQRLDSTPDGWKQCALTFLEQQALARDFGEIINLPEASIEKSLAQESADIQTTRNSPAGRKNVHWYQTWQGLLMATAASFFFAFCLGIGANQWMDKGPAGVDPIADGKVGGDSLTAVSDTVPIVVQENLSGQQRQYEVPVMNVANGQGDLDLAMRDQLPSSLNQIIKKMDVPYEVRRNMVSLTDKNGNIFYVPVDQIKFGKNIADYQ